MTQPDLASQKKQFLSEQKMFNFVYECKACSHFDDKNNTCSMGFPPTVNVEKSKTLKDLFCKYFEID